MAMEHCSIANFVFSLKGAIQSHLFVFEIRACAENLITRTYFYILAILQRIAASFAAPATASFTRGSNAAGRM